MTRKTVYSMLIATAAWLSMFSPAGADEWTPFIDVGEFNHDLQFFAPADLGDYDELPAPNIGWFFGYSRVHFDVTRAENAPQSYLSDLEWGNRFDIGYMTEEDQGWLFSLIRLNNLSAPNINVPRYTSVELNRIYRLKPFHNGSIIEPFIGGRFMKFDDLTGGVISAGAVENTMVTGQLGFRWWKQKGRWLLSAESRVAAGENFQHYSSTNFDEFVYTFDVRLDAAYQITRDIAINVGWQFIHYARGIGRNNNTMDNDEDLTMHGVTVGFLINR